ncbi:MAG: prepilin-type N-terminal cleavage/methylation domain-containing protein [Pirellulales bacterium]|nr:prepilin-type N-terminal cleavage/methylation domain-containing protein [Pirellulales bacterium]
MSHNRPNRNGFTLIEAAVVSVLLSLLVVLLSTAWVGLGQPSVDAMERCRLLQEAQMATLSLAEDLRGSVPTKIVTGVTFDPPEDTVAGGLAGVTTTDGSDLTIGFADSAKNVTYRMSTPTDNLGDNRLLRINGTNKFVVAKDLEAMNVTVGADVTIDLTFSLPGYRGNPVKTVYRLVFKQTLL